MRKSLRVSFVCSGNICRSPYAAACLQRLTDDPSWKDSIEITSAGTLGLREVPAHRLAISLGEATGLQLRDHRSQAVTEEFLSECDVVLGMAAVHVTWIHENFPQFRDRTYLLGSFPGDDLAGEDVEDPMGGDRDTFLRVFRHIDELIARIAPELLILIELRRSNRGSG